MAKVSDAASSGTTGLQWFKVAHDGLANGKWAVDTMIANQGWHYFNMPTCIAPGDYLLRAELIALHSAQNSGQAQCKSIFDVNDFSHKLTFFQSIWNALRSRLQAQAPTLVATKLAFQVLTRRTTPEFL